MKQFVWIYKFYFLYLAFGQVDEKKLRQILLLIMPLVSPNFSHSFCYTSQWCHMLLVKCYSFGPYINSFWLCLWYLRTLLSVFPYISQINAIHSMFIIVGKMLIIWPSAMSFKIVMLWLHQALKCKTSSDNLIDPFYTYFKDKIKYIQSIYCNV
jgi:hypothetical protein